MFSVEENIEVAMLQRLEAAYLAGRDHECNRIQIALQIYREAVAEVKTWE